MFDQPSRWPGAADSSFLGLSGMHRLAKAMVLHWEHDPAEHLELVTELETALGEGLLEVGEAVMREHGLRPPTDPDTTEETDR